MIFYLHRHVTMTPRYSIPNEMSVLVVQLPNHEAMMYSVPTYQVGWYSNTSVPVYWLPT